MTYIDCITFVAQHAQDLDVPPDLLPLVITNEAAMLAGFDSDRLGGATWD